MKSSFPNRSLPFHLNRSLNLNHSFPFVFMKICPPPPKKSARLNRNPLPNPNRPLGLRTLENSPAGKHPPKSL